MERGAQWRLVKGWQQMNAGVDASWHAAGRAWQEKRAYLNHDVLQNRVLSSVRAGLASKGRVDANVGMVLRGFIERRAAFMELAAEAPAALSPSAWFGDFAHTGMTSGLSGWLLPFIEFDFRATSWVPEAVADVDRKLTAAVKVVKACLKEGDSDLPRKLARAEAALSALSRVVSALPRSPVESVASMFEVRP